ncbi:MAG: hypothetical protein ACRDU8_00500 [Egibacteraceae bacterium]
MNERIEQHGAHRGELPVWLRVGDPPPSPTEALEALREVFEQGTPSYREREPRSDAFDRLLERLDDEDRELLLAYEEHTNHLADVWAADRFRLGFVLGLSGLLAMLDP